MFTFVLRSQPHWIGGRGNDWRMLLQADYSASFRMDAVHRGRQINESVMDDVAAGMLGALWCGGGWFDTRILIYSRHISAQAR